MKTRSDRKIDIPIYDPDDPAGTLIVGFIPTRIIEVDLDPGETPPLPLLIRPKALVTMTRFLPLYPVDGCCGFKSLGEDYIALVVRGQRELRIKEGFGGLTTVDPIIYTPEEYAYTQYGFAFVVHQDGEPDKASIATLPHEPTNILFSHGIWELFP